MVSIPRASKDIKPYNHFTPGPCKYEWERSLPDKKIHIKIGESVRKIFNLVDGPGSAQYNIHNNSLTKGTYMGYRPDNYALPIRHPSPAEYNVLTSQTLTQQPQYSIAQKTSLSPRQQDYNLGPCYYYSIDNPSRVKLPSISFSTQKRQFFDNMFEDTPGPQKYHHQLSYEDQSPKYSFAKEKRLASTQKSMITPGPGQYNQNESSRRGVIISKRKGATPKTQSKPGPGSYEISGVMQSPERGIRFTMGKRSLDEGSHVSPGPQQYGDMSMISQKKKYPVAVIGTSKRSEEIQERSPGPCMYNHHEESQTNNKHKIFVMGKAKKYKDEVILSPSPQKYSPRMISSINAVSMPRGLRDFQMNPLENPPGPGTYQLNNKHQYRFAHSFSKRPQDQPSFNPGPGQYTLKTQIDQQIEKAKYKPIKAMNE